MIEDELEEEILLRGTHHLIHNHDHLEPDPEYGDTIVYLDGKIEKMHHKKQHYQQFYINVGYGRQGTKWRVKWKKTLAKLDQLEQVRYELNRVDQLDNPIIG